MCPNPLISYIHSHGLRYTVSRALEKLTERLAHRQHRCWQSMRPAEDELRAQQASQPWTGCISVVVPVYNTQPDMLLALARSLLAQTYQNWEAVLYDGASTRPETGAALTDVAAMDPRFRVLCGQENMGISGNTNAAIAQARGEYCALCDHDDLLTPDALWRVAEAIAYTGADMLYTDEDKVSEDGRWHADLHLKPDFGPDTLRSGNYICHLMVLRRLLIDRVGGLRAAYDGSQDHDLALRCSELAECVVHIPRVLYHWRTVGASMSHQRLQVCMDAACRAVEDQLRRFGWPGTARMECGLIRLRYEISKETSVRVLLLGSGAAGAWERWPGTAVQRLSGENVEELNAAALSAQEDMLLVMDAAAEPVGEDFLTELMMYAQRDDVGAVTPMLATRRRPQRILAAGMAVMQDGRVCPRHAGQPVVGGGHRAQALTSHNVCAVSPACFMVRRDHFIPLDGSMDSAVTARWCCALSERGLHHVYTPHAVAVMDEQASSWCAGLPEGRLTPGFRDPCISPWYTAGDRADFKLRMR